MKIYDELDLLLKEYTERLHYSYEELYTKYSEIYTSIENEVNNGSMHSNRYSENYIPTKALKEFKTFLNNSINIK